MVLTKFRWLGAAALLGLSSAASADRILVLGDSLSAAYNMQPSQGWVSLLDARLQAQDPGRHQVINASISGESSTGGLARLPALLQQYKPDVVVIELGGNDALQGQPMSLTRGNFERMIGLSQAAGARVAVLAVVVPAQFSRVEAAALAQMYTSVTRASDVPLQPSLMDGISGRATLLQRDGLHPNAAAQPLVLGNAWPVIRARLSPQPVPRAPARLRWEQPKPH